MSLSIIKSGETATIEVDSGSTQQLDDEQKRLKTLVGRRHPKYRDLLPHWNFMCSTYDGGREWFKPNIFRYIKEGDQEFTNRLERAYRFNHTKEVVDLINKYLFKQEITRNEKDAPESLTAFWKRATKSGLSIKDFARQISKKTSQFGRVGIVIDTTRPDGDEEIQTRAQEKASGVKVYAYIVTPQQLLDYSYDEEGELNWVLIHEIGRDDSDPFTSTGEEIERFRLWTKTNWTLYELERGKSVQANKIVEVGNGAHNLGEVPVILADNIIGDEEYTSSALIDDIAYLDRAVANYLSNLDAIIQDQTFSQLAMPAQNVIPGEDSYNKMVEMGTNRVFLYDGEGGSSPFYLSPDVKQADLIITAVNKIINEIYHTVGLAGERTKQDNAVGIDNSSGVAKAYDFERVNALLAAKADSLEWIENKIACLVMKWSGEEDLYEGESFISYPDNFDTRGLYDEFDISARLMLIDAPDEVRRHQMEAVIDKLFPKLAKDLKQKMLKELKGWPVDPIELANRLTDKNGEGALSNVTTTNPGKLPTSAATSTTKPNKPQTKATTDNRQGQVTKQTQ
ncbi:phage portal protein [Acinetobacter brisouii]|uniref:phage portal protein n=1 Tax=Acinetobacter brisouii TaxID=396323 RepID=UPI00124E5345|nr:phage portal protein [Acinetobacter brisouii]